MFKGYFKAVLDYFDVKSVDELRQSSQWQKFARQEGLPNPPDSDPWEHIWQAIYRNSKSVSIEVFEARNLTTTDPDSSEKEPLQSTDIGVSLELQNLDGQTTGLLLQYSLEESQRIITHLNKKSIHSTQPWHQGSLSPAIIDQLTNTSSLIAAGLQMGQLFRVVGPPELISGISSGAYQMLQTSTGALGTVTPVGGGKFIGNLRFASAGVAPILAPVIAYQVLHAIVGTQQLSQINHKLALIEQTLEEFHVRHEATILGEIHYAINVLNDIIGERLNTGVFTPDMSNRLAVVEKSIVSLLERNRLLVKRFQKKAERIKSKKYKTGARNAMRLIKTLGHQTVCDMQCLVALVAADLKLEQALLLLAIQNNPTDVGRRQENITHKMKDYRENIENLPSVVELQDHAKACQRSMRWWERLFDFGQTHREVSEIEYLNLHDVDPKFDDLLPKLGGYVFWQNERGIQVFAMPGDDLKLIQA